MKHMQAIGYLTSQPEGRITPTASDPEGETGEWVHATAQLFNEARPVTIMAFGLAAERLAEASDQTIVLECDMFETKNADGEPYLRAIISRVMDDAKAESLAAKVHRAGIISRPTRPSETTSHGEIAINPRSITSLTTFDPATQGLLNHGR